MKHCIAKGKMLLYFLEYQSERTNKHYFANISKSNILDLRSTTVHSQLMRLKSLWCKSYFIVSGKGSIIKLIIYSNVVANFLILSTDSLAKFWFLLFHIDRLICLDILHELSPIYKVRDL